jgi:hypothetical protein
MEIASEIIPCGSLLPFMQRTSDTEGKCRDFGHKYFAASITRSFILFRILIDYFSVSLALAGAGA